MSTVKQVLFTQLKSYFDKQKVSVCQKRIIQAPCFNEDGGLRGYMLITLDSFWTLLRSKSPFLMVSWYCQFLLSGLHARTGQNFSALGITRSILVSMIVSLPVSFHNFINFVNFTVEAASSYESGQFPVGRRWAYVALARTKTNPTPAFPKIRTGNLDNFILTNVFCELFRNLMVAQMSKKYYCCPVASSYVTGIRSKNRPPTGNIALT